LKPGERIYDPVTDKQWSSDVFHKALDAIEKTLSTASSAVKFDSICQAMKQQYPSLCNDTIKERTNPRSPYWKHLVASAIQELKKKGELRKSDDGWIWIGAKLPPPPPNEPDKLAEEIKSLLEKLIELAKKEEKKRPRLTHDELIQRVKEMAEMLGKKAEGPWGPVYKHDCVWRDNPYANPKLVWEVCDKGNLDKDIASLIWAVKSWNAKGILVVFDELDFHTAQRKLAQESQICPLKAEDILKLHSLLQSGYAQAIRSIFTI